MIRNKLKLAAVLIGLLFLMVSPQQAQVIIDSFDDAPHSVVSGPATTPDTETGAMIGGFRTIEIGDPNKTAPTATSVSVDLLGDNVLSHNQSISLGGSSQVTWDAGGAGLGGIDLTAGGQDRISLFISAFDDGEADLSITVEDTSMISASLLRADDIQIGIGWRDFFFSGFTGGAVDFTSIDSIALTIDADPDADFAIDQIQTRGFGNANGGKAVATPEPSAFLLAALALTVGLGFTRFSRRRLRR